jgi:AcrR family transcriptional regulator
MGVTRRRGGRPSAEQAGDVDRRILQAATALFLEHGFEATGCEQVAVQAGASKASLYARYANKEALFEAVIRNYVQRSMTPMAQTIGMSTVQMRLRAAGESLLAQSLQSEVIAMMRAVITAVYRMPELARLAYRIGRDHCVLQVASDIAGEGFENTEIAARAMAVAGKFVDLALAPHQMRALMGEEPEPMLAEARCGLDDSIAILVKGGWLDGWK